jgi:hypothetical protein
MDERKISQAKTKKPHAFFDEPHEVVADPALSKGQKRKALDALEQDARQLSAASAEGMAGGEATGLHDVLAAKDSLELPPTAYAYDVVLKDLRSRLKTESTGDAHAILEQSIAALEAVARPSSLNSAAGDHGSARIGDPKPGSAAEVDAELALEKLDP